MRHCTLALASLVVAAATLGATSANAQESYPHGFIRNVEPGVTLHRATEVTAEEALANLPFLPGDRVWTDAAGRAEFQFPEGTVVRLDARSKLDYSAHDESRDERVVLRLWSGSLILRTRSSEAAVFEIETPGGLVAIAEAGVIRIDVEGGETQLSVYEGEASLDTGRDLVKVARGERTWVRWGDAPAEPEPFDLYAMDDFAEWDIDLESREAYAAGSQRYLPEELAPYAPQFESHGSWVYHQPVGYVWRPRVAVSWSPYSNGRWVWTHYGWTWVPYEPWGWAPHHYGRWGFSVSLGWYWWPGRTWGPAWVSWGVGGGYVGWCPLGWRNRPVVPWHHHRGYWGHHGRRGNRGYAVPRGSIGHERAWNVVRRGDLGRGNLARRRVNPGVATGLHVAESVDQRPDRAVGALTRNAGTTIPAAAAARRRPGSSARGAAGTAAAGATARGRSRGATAATPARAGVGWATSGLTGAAARARSRKVPSARTPSSASGLGAAARARPRAGAGGTTASTSRQGGNRRNPVGRLFESPGRREGTSRARPRNSGAASRSPATRSPGRMSTQVRRGPSRDNRLDGSRATTSRPSSSPRSRGTTSTRPRSTPSRSNTFSRSRSTTPRSSTSPRSRGTTSTRPRSRPSSRSSSSRPRSTAPRPSTSPRSRSAPSPRGMTSRPSSRPRSSSPPRMSSPSRSSAPRPGASSRSRSSGPSRGSVSRSAPSRSGGRSRSSSGSRSAARSRGGARRK